MDAWSLKWIAAVAVLAANAGRCLLPAGPLGELASLPLFFAFPLLAAVTSESCRRTGHWGRYLRRLCLCFLAGALPYVLLFSSSEGLWCSFLLPLTLAVAALWAYEALRESCPLPTALLPLLGACVAAGVLRCEFGFLGVGLVALLYLLGDDRWELSRCVVLWAAGFCLLWQPALRLLPLLPAGLQTPGAVEAILRILRQEGWLYLSRFGAALLSLPLLHRYNGTRGRDERLIFYLGYPLHLLLLLLLTQLLG